MQIELSRTMRTTETITLPAYFASDAGYYYYAIYAPDNMVVIGMFNRTQACTIERKVIPPDFTTDGLMRITEEQWYHAVADFQAIVNNTLNTLP